MTILPFNWRDRLQRRPLNVTIHVHAPSPEQAAREIVESLERWRRNGGKMPA